MKNSTTTNRYPLPKDKIWTRLPERVQSLEDNDLSDFTNTGIDPFVKASDLPQYKVYTALLTQSGGDTPTLSMDGPLVIGVTYEILDDDSSTVDFTNVGAPNNNIGTFFVATGTTPTSWGVNLLGQLLYNAGAPVATVLENTIGNIWFTFENTGQYRANSNGLFTDNKTTIFGGYYDGNLDVWVNLNNTGLNDTNNVFIQTGDPLPANTYLNNTPIEIRVYN